MNQQNEEARDLWSQIFERAAADLNATLHDPDVELESSRRELARRAFAEAGWSEAEIKKYEAIYLSRTRALEEPNSPGVGPDLEPILNLLASKVRRAYSEIGETAHEKVEVAIDPKAGVAASLTNVIMTDQGIVSVSSFLFRWCALIARAYTRTLYADLAHWAWSLPSPANDRKTLLRNPDLAFYWFRIFVSFAGTGTHALVPFRPSTPTEVTLFEQVAWSMELFTIAHEFGHHALGHRRPEDDPRSQEFQADAIALRVCERLEFEPFPLLPNPYTRTGAGASLMLIAIEVLRSFEGTSKHDLPRVETHPTVTERAAKISSRNLMQPMQLQMDQEFNGVVSRILLAVGSLMDEFRREGGDELVAAVRRQIRDAELELRQQEMA